MNPIVRLVKYFSKRARKKRAEIFRNRFSLNESTKILDLGSESGFNINNIIQETKVKPQNVYIADIEPDLVKKGSEKFGFNSIIINESKALPFEDDYFDIVYCSSVIEHVTVPKEDIWSIYSGQRFKTESSKRQKEFANEIKRVGKQFYVQTPYKYFPIESHTWLPFIAWLPRWLLIPILKVTNIFWVKRTSPDWHLLTEKEMLELFDDAEIIEEKLFGITKSIIAVHIHQR